MGQTCTHVDESYCPAPCNDYQYCYTCEDNLNDIGGGTDSSTHCWMAPSVFFVKVILPLMGGCGGLGIVIILLQRIKEACPGCPTLDGRSWMLSMLWIVTDIVAWADVHFWVMVAHGPPEQRAGFAVGGVFFVIFFICVAICLGAVCVRTDQPTTVVVQQPATNNTVVVLGPPAGHPGMVPMQPIQGYPPGYVQPMYAQPGYAQPGGQPGYGQPVYVAQGMPPPGAAGMPYQPAPMAQMAAGYPPAAYQPAEGPAGGGSPRPKTRSGAGVEGGAYA